MQISIEAIIVFAFLCYCPFTIFILFFLSYNVFKALWRRTARDNYTTTHTHIQCLTDTHTHTCRKSLNHLGQDSVATLDLGQKHVNTEHKEGFICGGRSPLHQPVFTGLVQKVEQRAATMKSWIGWRSADSWLCNVFSPVRKFVCVSGLKDPFFFKAPPGAEQGISISAHFIINSLEC